MESKQSIWNRRTVFSFIIFKLLLIGRGIRSRTCTASPYRGLPGSEKADEKVNAPSGPVLALRNPEAADSNLAQRCHCPYGYCSVSTSRESFRTVISSVHRVHHLPSRTCASRTAMNGVNQDSRKLTRSGFQSILNEPPVRRNPHRLAILLVDAALDIQRMKTHKSAPTCPVHDGTPRWQHVARTAPHTAQSGAH